MTDSNSVDLMEFARKSLSRGRGEWWIVSEMAERWQIDEPDARAIVARVSPGVYRQFLTRRRVYFSIGALLVGLSAVPVLLAGMGFRILLLSGMILAVGSALCAYGRPGLHRRPRGDAPTAIPGRMKPHRPSPFSTDPFEWK